MRKRTTIYLDTELVQEARRVLGTTHVAETIQCALQEIVNRDLRVLALAHDFSNLPLDEIRELRSHVS